MQDLQSYQTGKVEALLHLQNVRLQVRPSLHLVPICLRRIRQCVGEKNYKYFVSFLLMHSVWCLYLALIGAQSLIQYLNRIQFWGMTFNINGQNVRADPLLALQVNFE
jgi:hypothetical protein